MMANNKEGRLIREPIESQQEVGFLSSEVIRSEVNLLTLPFFALSRKGLQRMTKATYRDEITRKGQRIEIFWQVTAHTGQGYPGPFDKQVHKAIEQTISEILSKTPLPLSNPIPLGSLYGLCQKMGISSQGKNYRKIKEALRRITLTGVESRGAFYSKEREQWIEDVFHLYERIIFKGERLPDGTVADQNYLFLGSWYLQNINALYLKPLDYKYYRDLKSTIAQRLYELLGVKFYRILQGSTGDTLHPQYLRYRYSTLCQLLPITRQRHLSKAQEKLEPAHEELKRTGFLSKVIWRKGKGKGRLHEPDWFISYYPGEKAREEAIQWEAPIVLALSESEEAEAISLVEDILRVTEDEHSRPFYTKLAKLALKKPRLQDLIYRCLSEVKYEAHEGLIKTTKGAAFTDKLKRYCREQGIDLGLKSEQ